MKKELETAINLAKNAGDLILEFYKKGFAVEEKRTKDNNTEPVTEADRASSKLIIEGLKLIFPEDGILSEEEIDLPERLTKKRVWMIDPIDGTRSFVEKKDDFAVQIGLTENGKAIVGVVFQPISNRLYFAAKDAGAFYIENDGEPQKLLVSDKTDFAEMILAVSRSHRSGKMTQLVETFGFKNELPHGSVGLKIGLLARQHADLYIHLSPRTKFWDSCAPQIILEEAGGKLSDIFGEEIIYNIEEVQNYNGILATNGGSHQAVVAKLKPLLAKFGRLKVKNK
ncbi:MAG TPA: 3'(2'),5'-bisphosphate nucleotidase CysQ [Pyrinomonadaceae bacterium]|nr:3'(2'),5'-bisphosphate nucleotidase CysQ [Pyrinomonadaceae bacterium]